MKKTTKDAILYLSVGALVSVATIFHISKMFVAVDGKTVEISLSSILGQGLMLLFAYMMLKFGFQNLRHK